MRVLVFGEVHKEVLEWLEKCRSAGYKAMARTASWFKPDQVEEADALVFLSGTEQYQDQIVEAFTVRNPEIQATRMELPLKAEVVHVVEGRAPGTREYQADMKTAEQGRKARTQRKIVEGSENGAGS
jgi:hypothetical protein